MMKIKKTILTIALFICILGCSQERAETVAKTIVHGYFYLGIVITLCIILVVCAEKVNWKCLFGHKWNGCKCSRCGKTRDEQHDWEGCICRRCGKTRHNWDACSCRQCGKTRHDWKYLSSNISYNGCMHSDTCPCPAGGSDFCPGSTCTRKNVYRCRRCGIEKIEEEWLR